MSAIYPFHTPHRNWVGTIHVWGDRIEGFSFSHESASGNSWGDVHGPFSAGQDAIARAYAHNRDSYGGSCNVLVCEAAMADLCPDLGLASLPGDF